MDDEIHLGYQCEIMSMVSESYGRLWLSVPHLPDDTVSCTQAEAFVLAAETQKGRYPKDLCSQFHPFRHALADRSNPTDAPKSES